jgi:hypothetical protein
MSMDFEKYAVIIWTGNWLRISSNSGVLSQRY